MPYVNSDMRRRDVPAMHFIPKNDRSKQAKWPADENINASLKEPFFSEDRVDGKVIGNVFYASKEEARLIADEVALLKKNRQSLRDHLDARLGALFLQLVDCYDTGETYEEGKVEDQMVSSGSLSWVCDEEESEGKLEAQSAHLGTLPCVIAYPRDAYNAWKAQPKKVEKPAGHVLGKYSPTYHFNNACSGHITVVNEADSLMDWKGQKAIIVRPFALELLKGSATKEIDPLNGMRLFVSKLSATVDSLHVHQTDPSLKLIFKTYQEHLVSIRALIEEQPDEFLTLMLGIEIDENAPHVKKLREVIYPSRIKTLQMFSEYQSQIAARIELAKSNIIGKLRKPNLFDAAFKAKVLLSAPNYSSRMDQVLRRFFCMNAAQARQGWNAAFKPAKQLCDSPSAEKEIESAFDDISSLMHNREVDISLLRANLLFQLRSLHRWSQSTVAAKINQLSPSAKMYQQKISRLELGEKQIDETLATLFSRVFNVNRSIFISDLV